MLKIKKSGKKNYFNIFLSEKYYWNVYALQYQTCISSENILN